MSDERKEHATSFRDRLIAVEPLSPDDQEQLRKEIHAMFIRELSLPRRLIFGVVAIFALGSAAVCGFLAATEPALPAAARIGLGTGTLFGLGWALMAARLSWRGALDVQLDGRRMAAMVWVFTVLMMVFFLIVGMSAEDRLLGIMMMTNGLAFLVGAAVYWLSNRIEGAELATRERLLRMELRLAELCEKQDLANNRLDARTSTD